MTYPHPDPEGHLTDLTVSALRDLRDDLRALEPAPGHRVILTVIARLDSLLTPWGEGPTDDR